MAISSEAVKQIQTQTINLGELILEINPVTDKEWDAFEKLVSAHKNLMKIDSDGLLQLPLPLEKKKATTPKFRKDCPRCGGSGDVSMTGAGAPPFRPCNCNEIEDKAWPQVKPQWEKEAAPAAA